MKSSSVVRMALFGFIALLFIAFVLTALSRERLLERDVVVHDELVGVVSNVNERETAVCIKAEEDLGDEDCGILVSLPDENIQAGDEVQVTRFWLDEGDGIKSLALYVRKLN